MAISTSSAAVDIVPVLPDSGLIMRESSKMPTMPKRSTDTQVETPPLKKPMLGQSDLRIMVRRFTFSGNSQFPADVLGPLLSDYTNRELSFAELQQAAAVITAYYRNAGYFVAYAYLPEQTLEEGAVELAIFEGRLDDQHLNGQGITLLNETRLSKQILQNFLDTLPEGSLITETDMNHLSLMLNRLPGINAKVVLSPGKETGSSALSVKIKEAPLITGYASTDNYGLYATGYYRFAGGVSINDPFGFGDQLNLRTQTTETGDAVAGWADYNTAINGYGTRLGFNFAELHYHLGRGFTPLQANGIARTVGTTLSQPLLLRRNLQLTGFAHYEHRWMQDHIDLVGRQNDRQLNVVSFSFAGTMSDALFGEPGVTQAFINVSAGHVDFTNQQAYLLDQSTGLNTRGGYHKFNWALNRTQTVWGPVSLYLNFQGQVASKNLDTSEQISLGGPYGIRAYPVGEGSADEGWQFNVETRYQLPIFRNLPGYWQLIGFIDTGYYRINAQPLPGDSRNSQHLTGYGLGINWLDVAGFNVRTSLAWRDVSQQPFADPNAPGPMGYFQLSKEF